MHIKNNTQSVNNKTSTNEEEQSGRKKVKLTLKFVTDKHAD